MASNLFELVILMANKRSRATAYRNLIKTFEPLEIDIANVIMERMGSWDARNAFGNDIKCLYLYAARNVIAYLQKRYELIERY